MFKTLLHKNFQEVGAMYFRSKKKGGVLSGGAKIGMVILYIFIYISMLAAFAGISVALFTPISPENDWVVWSVVGIMAVVMATLINALTSYAQLYLARDNELLLSMPIKPSSILLTRSVSVYLMGVLYASMAWIPTIIVGVVMNRMSTAMVIGSILTLFVIGFMVLGLTCLIGWVVAVMSLKLKNQKLLLTAICLVLIGGLYYLQFQSNKLIMKLSENIDKVGPVMESRIYPFYKLGKGICGDIPSYLIFVLITAIVLVAAYYVLSKTFVKIATTSGSAKKAKFKQGAIKTSSVDGALLRRERMRFFNSITYMLNSGFGAIIMIAGGVILSIKSDVIMEEYNLLRYYAPEVEKIVPLVIIAVLAMLVSMSAVSDSAISAEGKQLWQIQTMPVDVMKIFRAKIQFSWYLQALPAIFLTTIIISNFDFDEFTQIVVMLFVVIFAYLSANFGLYINLKHPNLEWVSEQQIIKQGLPVTVTMFGGWGFGIVVAGLGYFAGKLMDYRIYIALIIVAMVVVIKLIEKWLRTKGVGLWMYLN